jgi:hypothetical protein
MAFVYWQRKIKRSVIGTIDVGIDMYGIVAASSTYHTNSCGRSIVHAPVPVLL